MSGVEGTEPISFRVTRWMLALAQMAACLHQFWVASGKGDEGNVVLGLVPLFGAIGIYRRVRWGRWVALVFLWGIILLSLGAMAPFRAGDDIAAGIEPPSIGILVTQLVVACGFSIWCIYILGKYEKQFRSGWF